MTGPNGFNQDVTVTNGKITIEKLRKGTYTITEKSAPNGYLLNTQAYNVEVQVNQTASKAIVNEEPTGTIQVIKKSEQGDLIKDTVFKVTANEDIKNVAKTKTYYTNGQVVANIKTDSNGLAEITNLPLGKYIVEETQATTGYLIDNTKHNVTLSYKPAASATTTTNDPAMVAMLIECTRVLRKLKNRLDAPLVAETYVTGKRGINQAQKEYQKLNNNKSRNKQ